MPRILIVADLGFASPYWKEFAEGLVEEGFEVALLTPSMNKGQFNFLGLSSFAYHFKILQTKKFHMSYRKYAGYPRVRRVILNGLENLKKKFLINPPPESLLGEHGEWVVPAIKVATRENAENPFDIVISTCLPFAAHVIGHTIKEEFGIPWVADYRDPWSYSHARFVEPSEEKVTYERRYIETADLVLTTSTGFGRAISQVFDGPIKQMHNGFDSLVREPRSLLSNPIAIHYPGQIYSRWQDFQLILQVLDEINSYQIHSGNKLSIQIYFSGVSTGLISQYYQAQNRDLPEWVILGKLVSQYKAIEIQKKADMLLLLNWEDSAQPGVMQTKLYEYLSTGNFIIATGGTGQDETAEILKRSGSAVNCQDYASLREFLLNAIATQSVPHMRNNEYLEQFSRRNQAKWLANNIYELLT
jgi:hypothetical protein